MQLFHSKPMLLGTILCFGVFAAISVYAYTAPTVAAPGNNMEITALDTSAADQVKAGGLGVGAFYAGKRGGKSLFDQQTAFSGIIRGGTPADQKSSVSVAGSVDVTGTLKTKDYFNSSSLKHGGSAETPLCADQRGNIILCP